jgi:hypothetical protein
LEIVVDRFKEITIGEYEKSNCDLYAVDLCGLCTCAMAKDRSKGLLIERGWEWRMVVVAHPDFGLKSARVGGACDGRHTQKVTFYFD